MKLERAGGLKVYDSVRRGSSTGWRYYLWCQPADHDELRVVASGGIDIEVSEGFFKKVRALVEQGEKEPTIGLYLEDE